MADSFNYANDIGLPFRFTEDCDLLTDEDDAIIDQGINLIAFTQEGTIPLTDFGSTLVGCVFDPLDPISTLSIDNSLRTCIEKHETRVVLDKAFLFDEGPDGMTRIVIVPYRIVPTNRDSASKLTVSNNT